MYASIIELFMPGEYQREIFEELGEVPEVSPIDPADEAYVIERRKLLGPIADISHPEFGRENRPDENFGLVADISHPDGDLCRVRVVSKVLDSSGVSVEEQIYTSTKY